MRKGKKAALRWRKQAAALAKGSTRTPSMRDQMGPLDTVHRGHSVTSSMLLPKIRTLNLISRKKQAPKIRGILQNNQLILLQIHQNHEDEDWGGVPDEREGWQLPALQLDHKGDASGAAGGMCSLPDLNSCAVFMQQLGDCSEGFLGMLCTVYNFFVSLKLIKNEMV